MGATERDRSRFQRRPMALCDREGLSGSTHGSRLVCLRGIRAIVALWRFGRPDNPEDGLSLGVKQGSPPAFWPSPEVRTGLIFSVTRGGLSTWNGPIWRRSQIWHPFQRLRIPSPQIVLWARPVGSRLYPASPTGPQPRAWASLNKIVTEVIKHATRNKFCAVLLEFILN